MTKSKALRQDCIALPSLFIKSPVEKRLELQVCRLSLAYGGSDVLIHRHLSICPLLIQRKLFCMRLKVLLAHLPRLAPRYYSIASSAHKNPNTLQFAFTVVDYVTKCGNFRKRGVATNWLQRYGGKPIGYLAWRSSFKKNLAGLHH